ncbi:AT-rich interactive domain-containing protein 1B-like isoform X3, partial [Vespula squamosa]
KRRRRRRRRRERRWRRREEEQEEKEEEEKEDDISTLSNCSESGGEPEAMLDIHHQGSGIDTHHQQFHNSYEVVVSSFDYRPDLVNKCAGNIRWYHSPKEPLDFRWIVSGFSTCRE